MKEILLGFISGSEKSRLSERNLLVCDREIRDCRWWMELSELKKERSSTSLALCQSHGYSWLLELLAAEMACGAGGSKQSSKLNTHMLQRQISVLGSLEQATEMEASLEGSHPVKTISQSVQLLYGLLKSNQPVIRHGFVLVLEKLLVQFQRPGLELKSTPPPSWEEGVTKDGLRSVGEQH